MTRVPRIIVPLVVLLVLAATALVDGYFRDEFYYLACSRRMAWGYVDQPPLSIALLWAVRQFAGDSLLSLRLLAAAASAATIALTGSIARRLGAGAFGECLAMVAAAVAPALLAVSSFYSMNVLEVLLWTAVARVLLEVFAPLEQYSPASTRTWIFIGILLGLGLLNKISMLWLGAGIAVGLLVTPSRRVLVTRGPWIAAVIAAAMFLPHVLWQVANDWPTLEFIRNASRDKMQSTAPVEFIIAQVMNMHPMTLPIWGAGLASLLSWPRFRPYRALGIACLVVAAIVILNRTSRASYLLPVYPMLFAAGGTFWDTCVTRRALRVAVVVILVCAGVSTAPLALPVLPADAYVRYAAALGAAPGTEERKELGRLPQFFADRQEWPQFVSGVIRAWEQLAPAERERAAVFTSNYGEAGAVEHFGRSPGMVAISGHNNYWLWGPAGRSGDVLVTVGASRRWAEARFARVEQAGETACGDCMPYENHLPIFICREPRATLAEMWPGLKHYD